MIVFDQPEAACTCHRKRVPGRLIVERYRESRIPAGAPAADVKANSRKLARDLVRMKRQLMIEGQRGMSTMLVGYFRKMLGRVCDQVQRRSSTAAAHIVDAKDVAPYGFCPLCGAPGVSRERRIDGNDTCASGHVYPAANAILSGKMSTDLGFGSHEAIWRQAIQDVLGPNANVELMADYLPAAQSIAARSYRRTCLFLGDELAHDPAVTILRRAQDMALRVTRINETTRIRLANTVHEAMQEGKPAAEIIRMVREDIPNIEASRVPTIVRTEVGNAIDQGTKLAMKESSTITHVRVIGCTGIEKNIPTLDGIGTCNICGVPVHRIDELIFHVNHTGTIIPQFFTGDGYNGPIYSGGT